MMNDYDYYTIPLEQISEQEQHHTEIKFRSIAVEPELSNQWSPRLDLPYEPKSFQTVQTSSKVTRGHTCPPKPLMLGKWHFALPQSSATTYPQAVQAVTASLGSCDSAYDFSFVTDEKIPMVRLHAKLPDHYLIINTSLIHLFVEPPSTPN
jgi:hypothetical protein